LGRASLLGRIIQQLVIFKQEGLFMKNNSAVFFGAIVVGIVCIALAVFYAIPGVNHPLASAPATASHWKHVALFAALAVLCIIGALVTRPKPSVQ
jgi:hypothetical protein